MSNLNNLPGNLRYTQIRDILLSNISLSSQSFSSSPPSHLTMVTGVQTGVLVLIQRKLLSCRAVVRALHGEVLESDHGVKCLSSSSLVLNLESHISLLLPTFGLFFLSSPFPGLEWSPRCSGEADSHPEENDLCTFASSRSQCP